MNTKQGRGRRYECSTADGPGMDWYLDALDELHERVFDQISDLPEEALGFEAPGSRITMGWLTVHLVSGEAEWVGRLVGSSLPGWLASVPAIQSLTPYGEPQPAYGRADELIALGRRVFSEWTRPQVEKLDPGRRAVTGPLETAAEVLSHLLWHWSFHSGHLGLIRLQWGGEYEWRFA